MWAGMWGSVVIVWTHKGSVSNMFGKHCLCRRTTFVKTCYTHTHTHTLPWQINTTLGHYLINLHWKHDHLLGQMGNILCVWIKFFWAVKMCHWVSGSWYFEVSYCLHLEGAFCLDWLPIKTKALCSPKHQELLSLWHSIISQKIWFLNRQLLLSCSQYLINNYI
jgi:hypothetical protein